MIPFQDSPDAGAVLQRGFALQQSGQMDQAVTCYRQVLALEPGNIEALFLLGGALMAMGDPLQAALFLQRAASGDPNFAAAHGFLGRCYKKLGNHQDAIDSFRRFLQLEPDNETALYDYAFACRDLGKLAEAEPLLTKRTKSIYAPGGRDRPEDTLLSHASPFKIDHDIEQLNYLMERGLIPMKHQKSVDALLQLRENLPADAPDPHFIEIPDSRRHAVRPFYNRLINFYETPALTGTAVNPKLDSAAIERDYQKNAPGITYFDNLLTEEALRELQRFCLESTIWFDLRFANGYLGTFMHNGFVSPLLVQIVEELAAKLPVIFGRHRLQYLWAFKYDSTMTGINLHADGAEVNVNFWITPDEANTDPNTGGLVVWDKEAPLDWDFTTYNQNHDAMRRFLKDSRANAVRVPYKQNRAVVFNSDLFHETDEIHFKKGYENRRINVTMLYGERKKTYA